MASGFTGETFLLYSKPRPFSTPIESIRRNVRAAPPFDDIVERQFIEMAAQYIEEIMFELQVEYKIRELEPPVWKTYKAEDEDEAEEFAPQRGGNTLKDFPIKFYPLYVRDIQDAIDTLVQDPLRPDSRGRHLANVFANNQGNPKQTQWTNETKLQNNIRVPDATGADEFKTINPLTKAINGEWPFEASDIVDIAMKIGVTMDAREQHNVTIDDPNFPQFLVGMPSGFIPGGLRDPDLPQEGRDAPMTSAGRPTRDPRITKNLLGNDVFDKDQGYSYMGALSLSLQQLRYQPPQIETFPTNIAAKWYTSNLVGPNTPNIAWTLAQPTEQAPPILNNWGSWFFSGFVGVEGNNLVVRTLTNPQEGEACQTECPYALFFPPETCECACTCAVTSRAIWWSSEFALLGGGVFVFNEVFPDQISPIRSKGKFFNRNTRLRIQGSSAGGRLRVGVKTSRLGTVDIPFINVIDFGDDGIRPNTGRGSQLPIDINLMDAIVEASANLFGGPIYETGGLDALLALSIGTTTGSIADATCPAEFTETGRICPNCLGNPCIFGASSISVDSVFLGEDDLAGDPITAYG